MDPDLVDLIWEMHTELGSTEPVHIISGYRSPESNAKMAAASSGVAKRSLHMDGKAIDVRLPGVPLGDLRDAG